MKTTVLKSWFPILTFGLCFMAACVSRWDLNTDWAVYSRSIVHFSAVRYFYSTVHCTVLYCTEYITVYYTTVQPLFTRPGVVGALLQTA